VFLKSGRFSEGGGGSWWRFHPRWEEVGRVIIRRYSGGHFVEKELKAGMRNLLRATEVKITESILRWKYKKEGKEIPEESDLQHQSRVITQKANEILSRRGKSILRELKGVYRGEDSGEGRS
jgi:hypothetical protein